MNKVLITLALFLTMLACSKDDDGSTSGSADIFMKATVDGQVLDVTGLGSPSDSRGTTGVYDDANKTFYLTGNNGDIILSFAIDEFPKATGSFTLGDIESGRVGNYSDNSDPENPVNYYSTSGTLIITQYDGKTVAGTFSFTAYSEVLKKNVQIEGGEFKVPFTEF
jgi:hypothetical protein